MSLNAAEQKIRKLARLPANCACPNCGTYKKFGFSTICIKFHTFVCNNCKSSHQAISHRCKSLTMSSWSDAEANELMRKGNEYARRTWLKKAPPVGSGGRPREGDDINVFKRFIETTYERRAYYGEDEGPVQQSSPARSAAARSGGRAAAAPSHQQMQHSQGQFNQSRSPPRQTFAAPVAAPPPRPAPAPAPVPVADLLDFSAPAPASFPPPTAAAPPVHDPFANFAANSAAMSPAPAAAPLPGTQPANPASAFSFMNGGGAGGNMMAAAPVPVPAPAPMQSFQPAPVSAPMQSFQPAPAPAPTPATNSDPFADFSGMMMSAPAPAAQPATLSNLSAATAAAGGDKKPVMNNMTMNSHSSAISSMNDMAMTQKRNSKNINIDPFSMQGNSMQQHHQQPQMSMMMPGNSMMFQQQQQQQQQQMPMSMMGGGMQMNSNVMQQQPMNFGMQNPNMMAMMNAMNAMQQQQQQQPMGGGGMQPFTMGNFAMNGKKSQNGFP